MVTVATGVCRIERWALFSFKVLAKTLCRQIEGALLINSQGHLPFCVLQMNTPLVMPTHTPIRQGPSVTKHYFVQQLPCVIFHRHFAALCGIGRVGRVKTVNRQ